MHRKNNPMAPLLINGNDLTFDDVRHVIDQQRPVELAEDARPKVTAARAVVDKLVKEDRLAYAITTGVGKLSDVRIDPAQNRRPGVNGVPPQAAGVGEPLSQKETRAMMLLRANSLAKGHSGVRAEL